MKKAQMKGKSVEAAVDAALQVLGGKKEDAVVKVITEGKAGMLGVIGGEEAEVEVVLREGDVEDSKQVLQEILDKMQFMAVVEGNKADDRIQLEVKGEDMGRIIGKEGATISAFETLVRSIVGRLYGERVLLSIDAGGYKKKREEALERLAKDAADEVAKTGKEKVLPPMNAADRRIIHLSLQESTGVTTYSQGEGRDRRLVIAPR
ncbi:RNA-binding cell elongation regulator Jag/EloR [Candidatus Margulisiibacteriota bacterium]